MDQHKVFPFLRHEINAEPIWNQCGTNTKSMWNQSEINVEPIWDQCGTDMKSIWKQCGIKV